MDDILAHIDAHLGETIARLQAFCQQPSIAAQGTGMEEMAALVRRTLAEAGAEAELVAAGGYPVVVARFRGAENAAVKTLMLQSL